MDTIAHDKQIAKVATLLAAKKRLVIITGAGISVSGGVPDFRSSDGLYKLVKRRFPDQVVRGAELFDASLFKDPGTTRLFYAFIAQLKTTTLAASPTRAHDFVRECISRKTLVRCYTQNIDSLEHRHGHIDRVVQLHGDLDVVVCTLCPFIAPFDQEIIAMFDLGDAPACPKCVDTCAIRVAAGKRAISTGRLRPNIVLYNEHHKKGDEIADLQAKDLKKIPDCLVVMGTSLKIVGVKRLIKDFASLIQAGSGGSIVFINKTAPPKELHSCFDTYIERDCDSAVNVIMQTWKEIDSAKLVKKEELAARQRARAAKLAREKAATTPITNMLKVVKKESSVTTSKLEKNVNVVIGSGKKASDTFVNQNSIESKQPAKDVKAQKENMAPLKASRLSKSLKAGTASVRAVGIVAAST